MNYFLRSLASGLLLLGAAAPAAAQTFGPWAALPTFPGGRGNYPSHEYLQAPTPDAIWVVDHDQPGRGYFQEYLSASADGGLSWQTQHLTGIESNSLAQGTELTDLWAMSGQEAWAIMTSYRLPSSSNVIQLYHTTTGPAGFAPVAAQVPVTAALVRFFTPSTGIVIGQASASDTRWPIYRTTDGGRSWQPVADAPALGVPAGLYLSPLIDSRSSAQSCAILGSDCWIATPAGVLHTPNAGLTWTSVRTPTKLVGLCFRDALHGLAYGAGTPDYTPIGGQLYRTTDGGSTWSVIGASNLLGLNGLAAVPGRPGTYLSVGLYPYLPGPNNKAGTYASYDDGQTWQALNTTKKMSLLATNPAGQVFSCYVSADTVRVTRFTASVLATAAPQAVQASIYPNPTTGQVHLPAAGSYHQVTVYDAAGRQCRTVALDPAGTTLDLSALSAGLYLLRLSGGTAAPQLQRVVLTH